MHIYTPITKITVISLIPSFKLERSSTDVFERNKLQIVVFVSYNQKKKHKIKLGLNDYKSSKNFLKCVINVLIEIS